MAIDADTELVMAVTVTASDDTQRTRFTAVARRKTEAPPRTLRLTPIRDILTITLTSQESTMKGKQLAARLIISVLLIAGSAASAALDYQ